MNQPPDWLVHYTEHYGFSLVFYDTKTKAPSGPDARNWQTRQYTAADYREGQNVGVKLGVALTPKVPLPEPRYLVDIDFDYADGQQMAKYLLPNTNFVFGRASRPVSHAFYTTSQPITFRSFNDIDGSHFVELRGITDAGTPTQTMVPPSIHPSGERVELRAGVEITHADDILRRVAVYGVGCLLLKHLGPRGVIHDVRLAIAGFLLRLGLSEDETIALGTALCVCTGNDAGDVVGTVRTTASKLRSGSGKVAGAGQLLEVLGGKDDKTAKKIIRQARSFLGVADWKLTDRETIDTQAPENVRLALHRLEVELKHDRFADRLLIRNNGYYGPLSDAISEKLWTESKEKLHFHPSRDFFETVMRVTARNEPYHPVKDYLDALRWDGTPRLDEWLIKYGGAGDSRYTRAVGSLTLIAAVRRVRQPGCKFDELLVLESGQGQFKSSALRSLCPNDEWFSDDLPLDVDSKQVIERTGGKWIIEAAELSGYQRSRIEHLKAFLSRQVDGPVRLAYERIAIERPRQFIIIGTTNAEVYLKDKTGNRRFWPVRVQPFNIVDLLRDRDQLWAEAAFREASGASIRMDASIYGEALVQQERREADDPWREPLRLYVKQLRQQSRQVRTTTEALFARLGVPTVGQTMDNQERITVIMQSLKFRRVAVRVKYKDDDGRDQSHVVRGWGRDFELNEHFEDERGQNVLDLTEESE